MKRAFAIFSILLLAVTASADHSTQLSGSGSDRFVGSAIAFQAYGGGKGTDWSTGATILADGNVVSHATWNGSAISDTTATWTQNGTVPQVTTGPFYPTGFGNSVRAGAGQFSAANNYTATMTLPTGGWLALVAFTTTSTSSAQIVLGSGTFNTNGMLMQINTSAQLQVYVSSAGADGSATCSGVVLNGPNVAIGGYDGTNVWCRLNGGASVSAAASYVSSTSFTIGQNASVNQPAAASNIYEVYATSTAYTDAKSLALEKTYLGQVGTIGEQLAVTRATTASETLPTPNATTCSTTPCLFTWPTGVGRISNKGMTVEAASTNKVLQSEAQDNAAWTKGATLTVTANNTVAPDGNMTADQDAGGAAASTNVSDSTGFVGNTSTWTGSIWVKASANNTWNLTIRDQAGAGSDLCTTADTATTTWRRVTVSCAGSNNNDNIGLRVNPGANQTVIVWGAQLEQSAVATSYIATTSAAVTRNADSPIPPSPSSTAKNTSGTLFAKVLTEAATLTNNQTVYKLTDGGSGAFRLDTNATNWQCTYCDSAGTCNTASQAIAANPNTSTETIRCTWDTRTNVSISVNSAAATTTAITGTLANAWADSSDFLGESAAATNDLAGFVSNVCVGFGSTTGCP